MVHSRGAGGSPLSQEPLPRVTVPSPTPIRDDLDEPVMVVQAEGDVIGSNLGSRQPDTSKFRLWEIAGTSHADAYTVAVGASDSGDGQGAVRMLGFMRNPLNAGCDAPDQRWFAPLDRSKRPSTTWRSGSDREPRRPPRRSCSSPRAVPSCWRATSTATRWGCSLTPGRRAHRDAEQRQHRAAFCRLFGSTTPFTPTQLAALYPTHDDFVRKWTVSLFTNVANGFLLPEDAAELYDAAAASTIPN